MKYLLFALVFAALAFANNDGCTETSVAVNPHSSGRDDITLTLVNDWTLANQALGLDIFEGPGQFYVLGADNNNGRIQVYDAISGSVENTLPLDAANGSCFGVAWNNDYTADTYYTNDWSNNFLYYTENFGSSWTTVPNPAGDEARGMDFDGVDYWCTNGDGGGLWRFQPGVCQDNENIPTPEVPSLPSGLTVFPYNGNIGIVITTYNPPHKIYVYEWDGSTLSFIGSAICPVACSYSFGLAYAETNGNIFWGYSGSSDSYHLAEFSFSIQALEQSSWGSIKSSF